MLMGGGGTSSAKGPLSHSPSFYGTFMFALRRRAKLHGRQFMRRHFRRFFLIDFPQQRRDNFINWTMYESLAKPTHGLPIATHMLLPYSSFFSLSHLLLFFRVAVPSLQREVVLSGGRERERERERERGRKEREKKTFPTFYLVFSTRLSPSSLFLASLDSKYQFLISFSRIQKRLTVVSHPYLKRPFF